MPSQPYGSWAYDHSVPSHPKYTTLEHSVVMTAKGTLLFLAGSLTLRHLLYDQSPYPLHPSAPYVAVFLFVYLVVMIGSRYYESGCPAIYESLWACNMSMLLAAVGCAMNDSFLLRTVLIVVSVDQLLWYIDLGSFALRRKFVSGVAKYIIWPQTSKVRLATTFHHVWFLPLLLFIVHPTAKFVTFTWGNYVLSCMFTLLLAIIGRITTPKEIIVKKPGQKPKHIYMNLNLSWELWKDLKMGFLKKAYEVLPPKSLIVVVSLVWDVGNLSGLALFWGFQLLTR